MNRRRFLQAATGGTALLAAGCGTGAAGTRSPATGTTGSASAAAADWTALAHDLSGRLLRPQDADYPTARLLYNPRFDGVHPAAVAYASSAQDVRTCLAFARRYGTPVTARCGGHSYAGYSTGTGLVVDVSSLSEVTVDGDAVQVGSGVRLIDLYAKLAEHQLTVPGGSCPTVGIAGLVQGGGIGVTGRAYGLTCDNLLAAQVVSADGRIVEADRTQHDDLFWALRGGGGGNFGVATSFRFSTHPAPDVSVFSLSWPWSRAAEVVRAWQTWAPSAPDRLWSNLHLSGGDGTSVQTGGLYLGPVDELGNHVDTLVRRVGGTAPTSSHTTGKSYLDAMLYMAGCSNEGVPQCHMGGDLPGRDPAGTFRREAYAASSDVYTRPLSEAGAATAVHLLETGHGVRSIALDALGGAINRVGPGDTAFPHRGGLFMAQYIAQWDPGDPASVVDRQTAWPGQVRSGMRSYTSGGAYVNYLDPGLSNWADAYYGPNLGRLRSVKAAWDPQRLFTFAQGL